MRCCPSFPRSAVARAAMLCAVLATALAQSSRADFLIADPTRGVFRYDEVTGESLGTMIYQPTRAFPNGQVQGAWGMVYGPDGNLYVAEDTTNRVSKYHGITGALLQRGFAQGGGLLRPRRMAIGPDGDLYVPSLDATIVSRFDGQTGAFVETITDATLSGPNNVAFGPDGALYISNNADPPVLRYDLQTKQFSPFVTDSQAALGPCGLAFGPDGNLYVGGITSDSVRRYDGATGAYLDDFVAPLAQGLADSLSVRFGPDDNLYVISNDQELSDVGRVLRFDPTGQFIDAFITASGSSDFRDIVFTPDFNPVTGDTDNDNDVDLDDLNFVRNNFGATAGPVLGDTTPFDGDVDLDDLNAVRNRFGASAGSAAVPEPGTCGLALVALLGGALWRRGLGVCRGEATHTGS